MLVLLLQGLSRGDVHLLIPLNWGASRVCKPWRTFPAATCCSRSIEWPLKRLCAARGAFHRGEMLERKPREARKEQLTAIERPQPQRCMLLPKVWSKKSSFLQFTT